MLMSNFEISKTFYFEEYNIIEFLKRYKNLCVNYDLKEKEKLNVFEILQYSHWAICSNYDKKNNWKRFCQIFDKNY